MKNGYLDETLNRLLEKHINGEQMTAEETEELHEHALMGFHGIKYRYQNMFKLYEVDAIVCELAEQPVWAQMIREHPFYHA